MVILTTEKAESILLEEELINFFIDKEFPRVEYVCDRDGDTIEDNPKLAIPQLREDPANPGQWETVTCVGIRVRNESISLDRSSDMRVVPQPRKIASYEYSVLMEFPCHVALDFAREELSASPPVIAAVYSGGTQLTNQYTLDLTRIQTQVSPRADAERGTVATFTFRATPARN